MSTSIQPPRRGVKVLLGLLVGVVILALVAIVVVALRSPTEASPALKTAPPGEVIEAPGRVEFGSRSAQVNDAPQEVIRFSAPEMPAQAWEAAQELADSWIITSPLEISTVGPVQDTVTLTRVYPVPVPEEAVATFAYFDPDLNVWLPVASELSEDRRTLTATVDHLSTWTDVISGPATTISQMANRWAEVAGETISAGVHGAGDVLVNLSDIAFYTVASVIDTTAQSPVCNGGVPDWAHPDVVVMEDALANPLHWCAGSDPNHADTLVVKVANNRGYPVRVSANTEPLQAGPDGVDHQWLADFFRSFDVYGNLGNSLEKLTFAEGFPLAGGESATLTFSRPPTGVDQIVVTAAPAEQSVVLAGIAMRQLVPSVTNLFLGENEFLFVASQCVGRIGEVLLDPAEAVSAVIDCLTSGPAEEALRYFLVSKKNMTQVAARELGSRMSFYFTFASVSWQLHNYYRDINLPEVSRTLSVSLKPQADTAPDAGTDGDVLGGSTEIVRLSPVSRDGQERAGWTRSQSLQTESGFCLPSAVALDSGIYTCGPNALSANACFYVESTGVFYCPLSPFQREYRVFDFRDGFRAFDEEATYPWGLELDDGRRCVARQGGAWGARADLYKAVYSCDSGDEFILVAPGESGADAVDDSGGKWTVRMGQMGVPGDDFPAPRTVGVSAAYYAGWED